MLSPAELVIIDRARNPQHAGELVGATHTLRASNLSCGDEVTLYLAVEDGLVQDARHLSRACSICTASTDLLCADLIGKPWPTSVDATSHVAQLGIELSPGRQKCAELPLQTLNQT